MPTRLVGPAPLRPSPSPPTSTPGATPATPASRLPGHTTLCAAVNVKSAVGYRRCMSDAIERPEPGAASTVPDPGAWAQACAEDFAAEQARRRAVYGPEPVSAAEELRRFFDSLSDKVSELRAPGATGGTAAVAQTAAQQFAKQFLASVKTVVEPVVERNPQVFDHLATMRHGDRRRLPRRSSAAGSRLVAGRRTTQQPQADRPRLTAGPRAASGNVRRRSGARTE